MVKTFDYYSVLSLNTAILLQPIQFILNLVFIPIFLVSAWNGGDDNNFKLAIIVMSLGVLNMFICFTDPRCRQTCKQ